MVPVIVEAEYGFAAAQIEMRWYIAKAKRSTIFGLGGSGWAWVGETGNSPGREGNTHTHRKKRKSFKLFLADREARDTRQ